MAIVAWRRPWWVMGLRLGVVGALETRARGWGWSGGFVLIRNNEKGYRNELGRAINVAIIKRRFGRVVKACAC